MGGSFAKYLGFYYHKQNIGVSSPGITPIEYKFKKKENYYKYFKSNLIDIILDRDMIPRFEVSGGVSYRVLCEKGIFACHTIARTFCQMGATCKREDLTGDICISRLGKDTYESIRKLAGLKSKIPDDYNN